MMKPEQTSTRLQLQRGDMGRAQPCRLGTVDLPVLAASEHPVDHAAVKRGKQGCRNAAPRKVHMRIQCAAKAPPHKLTARSRPPTQPLR